jgi:hypothetical protein
VFIHIGGDVIVFLKNLIAILDLEKTTVLQDTRKFLKTAEEEGFVMTIGDEMPKSVVLVETEYRYQVYLSPISPATLRKRCNLMISRTNAPILSNQELQF